MVLLATEFEESVAQGNTFSAGRVVGMLYVWSPEPKRLMCGATAEASNSSTVSTSYVRGGPLATKPDMKGAVFRDLIVNAVYEPLHHLVQTPVRPDPFRPCAPHGTKTLGRGSLAPFSQWEKHLEAAGIEPAQHIPQAPATYGQHGPPAHPVVGPPLSVRVPRPARACGVARRQGREGASRTEEDSRGAPFWPV